MVFNMQSLIFVSSLVAVTVYLIVAAAEDRKYMEVTRWKHLIGFVPGVITLVTFGHKHTEMDIIFSLLFALGCVICGLVGIYGLADGFVFGNLTLWFGGIGGRMGIGVVVLIMVVACFWCFVDMVIRIKFTVKNIFGVKDVAFVPHILNGYVTVMIAVFIYSF